MSSKVTINGRTVNLPSGKNVSIINNVIYINGKRWEDPENGEFKQTVKIVVSGDLLSLDTDGEAEVQGNVMGDVDAGNGASIGGDVRGSVKAGNSLTVRGSVGGDARAGNSIHCGNIAGSAKAGGGITRS